MKGTVSAMRGGLYVKTKVGFFRATKKTHIKLKIKMKGWRIYGGIRDGEKEKKALLMKLSVKGEMSPRRGPRSHKGI